MLDVQQRHAKEELFLTPCWFYSSRRNASRHIRKEAVSAKQRRETSFAWRKARGAQWVINKQQRRSPWKTNSFETSRAQDSWYFLLSLGAHFRILFSQCLMDTTESFEQARFDAFFSFFAACVCQRCESVHFGFQVRRGILIGAFFFSMCMFT